jgi:hypothetical protein
MRQYNYPVFRQMYVCLQTFCAYFYRSLERPHRVLWELGLVPSVGNSLW